jgi:pilus assembly protein CpaB
MIMLLVVGGLVVAYVGKRLLAKPEAVATDRVQVVPMAIQDIPAGTIITEAHLAKGRMSASKLEPEHVLTNEPLLGRVVKNPIKHATPIKTTDLYLPNEFPELQLSAGMKAITLPMGATTVEGLVKEGSRVDIHFTPASAPDMGETGGYTMTLMKAVKVVAMNRNLAGAGARNRASGSMTVEVSPEQANILLLCKDKGQLNLTYTNELVNTGRISLADADKATLAEILNVSPGKKPTPPNVTELYMGAGRRMQTFKDGLRSDRYGIERFDYNRNTAFNGDFRNTFPYDLAAPNYTPNNGGFTSNGGFYSVPNGGGDQGGQGGAGGGFGNGNGFGGNGGAGGGGFNPAPTPEGR